MGTTSLRLKPIQLVRELPAEKAKLNDINEFVASFVLRAEFLHGLKLPPDIANRYHKELVYYFKYRDYNAQSLEAMLTALVLGSGKDPFHDE